ncbi:Mitochondrial chaperone BCS1 [Gracilaria domingensis]|nr:Mitochondrial chaperone BCS1 [Gracilaria domingensis]
MTLRSSAMKVAQRAPVVPVQNGDGFVPKASMSHFQPEFIEHIASLLNAKPEALTTLTISRDTPPVYASIVDYVAVYDPPPNYHHRTGPRNLYMPKRHPFESTAMLDEEEEDENSDPTQSMVDGMSGREMRVSRHVLRRMRQMSDIQPGKGIREQKCRSLVPRLLFDLGECVVLWPPPAHVMPSAVRNRRRELFDVAKEATEFCSPTKRMVADSNGVIQELVVPTNTVSNAKVSAKRDSSDGDDSAGHEAAESEDPQSRFEVFIAQYEIGLPIGDGCSSTVTERKMLLATAHGGPALTKFLSGVASWKFEKDRLRRHKHCCYELYRFRSEGGSGFWESQGHRRARPIDSVVLAEGQMNNILQDVTNFLQPSTKKWFSKHGLSHRRSYLFYGKPGTGKTSTIRAIAGEFGLNCCFLSMTDASFSNQRLFDALRQIPSNALLVLEDVDSLFNEDRSSKATPSLTFSGMLNALDGIASSDGVITVMTTNHMERLESALIRGGRVDRRFYFDWPSERQLQRLFLSYYKDAPKELAAEFSHAVFERREGIEARSIATLQQLFVFFREDSAKDCVARMDDFFQMHFPTPPHGKNDSLYT